jgi:hypothetical protein
MVRVHTPKLFLGYLQDLERERERERVQDSGTVRDLERERDLGTMDLAYYL